MRVAPNLVLTGDQKWIYCNGREGAPYLLNQSSERLYSCTRRKESRI
jgi:hypothetical protein